ncbi:MAG: M14 family zinc carboxypeptidase [Bacillota bacterium]|nr:M14 family zinc carboxypeptidase [Bacillota bacterium]HHU43420.1 hypothetical protein [Clostridiales bacterium]
MKSYQEIEKYVEMLGGDVGYIGVTYLGYPIPVITKGRENNKRILLVGGVHAREYITSYLLFELIKEYDGECLIDCVPVLNIDGMLLSRLGLGMFDNKGLCEELLRLNQNSEDFSLWKANIRGVDLNVNFDADWGGGEQNILYPASANYIGPYPHSEKETQAIVELINKKDYNMIVAYHSKGEEIFYGFGDNLKHKKKAQKVADFLGYELKTSQGSAGGLKDYAVDKLNKFSITIEVGEDRFPHPYPMGELENLVKRHRGSLELFCKLG